MCDAYDHAYGYIQAGFDLSNFNFGYLARYLNQRPWSSNWPYPDKNGLALLGFRAVPIFLWLAQARETKREKWLGYLHARRSRRTRWLDTRILVSYDHRRISSCRFEQLKARRVLSRSINENTAPKDHHSLAWTCFHLWKAWTAHALCSHIFLKIYI